MMIALTVLGVWVAFALVWGEVLVRQRRREQAQYMTPREIDIVARAGQDWFKTGRIDERYIQELEAHGRRAPGVWRKIAR